MNFQDIETLWASDAHIDSNRLDKEALNIPKLHAKYYSIYTKEKASLYSLKEQLLLLEHKLDLYYSSQMTLDEMKDLGLEPLDKRILKPDVSRWISVNNEVILLKQKIGIQNEKIEFIKSILQQINQRSFIIKDAIAFQKFQAGEF